MTLKLSKDKQAFSHVLAGFFHDHELTHRRGLFTTEDCPVCTALTDLVTLKQSWLEQELTKAKNAYIADPGLFLETIDARLADVKRGKL